MALHFKFHHKVKIMVARKCKNFTNTLKISQMKSIKLKFKKHKIVLNCDEGHLLKTVCWNSILLLL